MEESTIGILSILHGTPPFKDMCSKTQLREIRWKWYPILGYIK